MQQPQNPIQDLVSLSRQRTVLAGIAGTSTGTTTYPPVHDREKVGSYPYTQGVFYGGGKRYDRVLEYRVWLIAVNPQYNTVVTCTSFEEAEAFFATIRNAMMEKNLQSVLNTIEITALIEQDWCWEPVSEQEYTRIRNPDDKLTDVEENGTVYYRRRNGKRLAEYAPEWL